MTLPLRKGDVSTVHDTGMSWITFTAPVMQLMNFSICLFKKKKEKEKMVCVQRNSIKKWSCVQVCVATQLCSAHEGAN